MGIGGGSTPSLIEPPWGSPMDQPFGLAGAMGREGGLASVGSGPSTSHTSPRTLNLGAGGKSGSAPAGGDQVPDHPPGRDRLLLVSPISASRPTAPAQIFDFPRNLEHFGQVPDIPHSDRFRENLVLQRSKADRRFCQRIKYVANSLPLYIF